MRMITSVRERGFGRPRLRPFAGRAPRAVSRQSHHHNHAETSSTSGSSASATVATMRRDLPFPFDAGIHQAAGHQHASQQRHHYDRRHRGHQRMDQIRVEPVRVLAQDERQHQQRHAEDRAATHTATRSTRLCTTVTATSVAGQDSLGRLGFRGGWASGAFARTIGSRHRPSVYADARGGKAEGRQRPVTARSVVSPVAQSSA